MKSKESEASSSDTVRLGQICSYIKEMISGWAKRIFAAKLVGWTIRRKGEILERGG